MTAEFDWEELDRIERSHPSYEAVVIRLIEKAFEPKENPEFVQSGEVWAWLNSLIEEE